MSSYTVEQGETLSSVAERFGFYDFATIWDHGDNAELKKRRKDPHILMPGDVVAIPDKREKTDSVPTGNTHTFQVKTTPLKLKLVLLDVQRKPRPGVKNTLSVSGADKTLNTGTDGSLEQPIPPSATKAKLADESGDVTLLIGYLDPIDERSGQIGRLNNLGYEAGPRDKVDDERLRSAVEEFQCNHGLTVDGVCGPKTQESLKQAHGC